MNTKRLVLAVTAAVATVAFAAGADAAPCTAATAFWDPDPNLVHSTSCGPGIGANDSEAGVEAAEPSATDWTLVGSVGDPGLALVFEPVNGKSGTWQIDADLAPATQYLIVIKDGSIDPLGADTEWAWFIVDTDLNVDINGDALGNCFAGYEFCGTWSMYGGSGTGLPISHMSLYIAGAPTVAEPSSLALLGLGLLGGAWVARRRHKR